MNLFEVKMNLLIIELTELIICKMNMYLSMCFNAPPCFGQSSKGKILLNQHVKSQESLLIDPGEKHMKTLNVT